MRRFFFSLKQPERVFLIVALLSGFGLCFLIPAQSGFDEITHLARIWEISGGYLIPNQKLSQGPNLPMAFSDISYRNQFFYDPVDPNFFSIYGNKRIDWNNFTNHQTRSVYFPALYLPQAIAVGLLGRLFDAPVLLIVFTCRLLYLLGYILFAFLAIRLIPIGKWLMVVLALAPMAMFQAATISPDANTNGAGFLFVAWVLRLALQEKPVTWKQLWITIGVTALLLSVKVNAVSLLPLLLFLVWKGFETKKMLPILAGAVVFLFAGEVVGWNVLAYSKYYVNASGFGASGQLAYILSNPLEFGATLFHDLAIHGVMYLRDWVAIYGYSAGRVPPVTYLIFGLALAAAWLFSPAKQPINARTRTTLILTGIVGIFVTILTLYLAFTSIGSVFIEGVQGRYFIPVLPALLLGLVPGREVFSRNVTRIARAVVGAGTGLALAVYMLGVYNSFYVVCGTSLYIPGLCYQPVYMNWESDSQLTQPVIKDVVLKQEFIPVCTPLRSIRVWSASLSPDVAGETRITLKDVAKGAVLVEESVNNQAVADYAWVELPFSPVEDAKGKQFVLEITSDLSDPAAGISFGVTARREYWYGMIINNVPVNFDLMFQYGCEPLKLKDAINKP